MKRSIILTKAETTFGDESLALIESDALMVSDFNMERYAGDRKERNLDHAGIGNQEEVNVDEHTLASFSMEAAPSEAAATAPANGHVIEACGFDETIDSTPGSETVTYSIPPTVDALRTGRASVATWEYDPDTKLLQKSYGQRGSLAIEANEKDYVRFLVSGMRGNYLQPAVGVAPAIAAGTWAAFKKPIAFIKDHIKTATIDGRAVCLTAFKYDWGMQLAEVGTCPGLDYSDYKPTLEATIKAPALDVENFWIKLETGAPVVVALKVSDKADTQFKRITVSTSSAQITNIDDKGEVAGLRSLVITFKPLVQATILLD